MTTATAATVTAAGMAMGSNAGGASDAKWDYGHGLMLKATTMATAAMDITLVMAIVVDTGGASDAEWDDDIRGTAEMITATAAVAMVAVTVAATVTAADMAMGANAGVVIDAKWDDGLGQR